LLNDAYGRIKSDAIRALTIKACNDMVGADFKRDQSEVALLKRIVTGLGG
jgi:hypothetical protein